MRLYNQKAEREGRKDDHAFAKEILAGIAGASVDGKFTRTRSIRWMTRLYLIFAIGLVESKGLDFVDREKAKRHAEKQAEELYRYLKWEKVTDHVVLYNTSLTQLYPLK